MKLYELTDQYEQLLELMRDGEIEEDVIADTLEGLSGEINEKLDGVCAVIKTLLAEAEAMKAEAKKLSDRAAVKVKRAENMKNYLSHEMGRLGMDSFESARHLVKFNKGGQIKLSDEAAVIAYLEEHYPDLVTVKTEVKPDKTGIKKMLKDGIEIPFASIEYTISVK